MSDLDRFGAAPTPKSQAAAKQAEAAAQVAAQNAVVRDEAGNILLDPNNAFKTTTSVAAQAISAQEQVPNEKKNIALSKERDNASTLPAPASVPDGPTISSKDARSLFLKSLDPNTFFPNPLGTFDQPIYHFRLLMTEFKAEFQPPVADNIKNLQQIVIAETGITGFNIKEVQIEDLVGPNHRTQNVGATKFVITVVEPMGTSFLDRIYKAAQELSLVGIYGNYRKIFYLLELSFKGYDANTGLLLNNILADTYDNNGIWLWQLAFVNIETDLTVGGGTYVITAIPYNETAYDEDTISLPETITQTAIITGTMLDRIAEDLNKKN